MIKGQLKDTLSAVSQVLPFLTITITFVGLAYTYGHNLSYLHLDSSYELARLSYTYFP